MLVSSRISFFLALALMQPASGLSPDEKALATFVDAHNTESLALLERVVNINSGTQNFAGAVRSALGVCGATDIAEFHGVEMVIAPQIGSEGKVHQRAQHVGMGR